MDMEKNEEEINEEEFKDNIFYKMERGIVNWGSRKKYPTIVSFIIAIVIPIFGLYFVNNQVELRKIEGKAPNHILVLAAIVVLLWWGALIVTLFIIF